MTISDKASDRYLSPRWVLDLAVSVWPLGIDLDPFHDPKSHVRAKWTIDCREGGDAYVDPLPGVTMFANGPYSSPYPGRTAELCANHRARGGESVNLCPAAPGSEYWARWVWPHATAIAWLGRLAFEAAVDMHDKGGRLVCKAGKAMNGNRTEIALVYTGNDPELFRRVYGRRAAVSIVS